MRGNILQICFQVRLDEETQNVINLQFYYIIHLKISKRCTETSKNVLSDSKICP